MKLAKTYEPGEYEPNIYALWEASGAFEPSGVGEPYSIVMPPPNANGSLHTGHSLTFYLQDILIRYHRMRGFDTAYLPGSDHAGFETWVVFEKELAKQGKTKLDFSREQLYADIWKFVDSKRGIMDLQLRAMGVSASWQNETFTLDKKVVETVYSTFKKMWDDGLIYRGERIVNYCTKHKTSFADIEIEHRQEKTKLWSIAYQLTDDSGEIVAATSRPETKLGQSALVVNPNDERYKQFIGREVYQPLIPDKPIPVIADEHVDPAFGTGAVTVTPAHDPNDFEIAKRHNLPIYELIDQDGKITGLAPSQFIGYTVLEARGRIVAALEAANHLRGVEDYTHTINVCYKCGTTIEPMVMDQWFIKVAPLIEKVVAAIEAKDVTFTPENKGKVLVNYLKNLHDWNISRQIAWGIPIPAFQNILDHEDWIFDTRVEQPMIEVDGKTYRREEDTFDTWFSSGQWPYVTTDYLTKGDLAKFYPTSVLETGQDILYQWVARMLMLGIYRTEKVPFKHVYLHGMVLDGKGQKMSKSKGNVVDVMEPIAKFGSDALRMGVVSARSAAQSQALLPDRVVTGRNFANKLWNVARYIEGKIADGSIEATATAKPSSIADYWIIEELNNAIDGVEKNIQTYRFAEATDIVYHFVWGSLADWYLEASKAQENLPLLGWVLETSLKLVHPFAPFVTETIWQTLGWQKSLLIQSPWPEKTACNEISSAQFRQLQALVSEARYVSQELGGKRQVLLFGADSLIGDNMELIKHLASLEDVKQTDTPEGLRLAVAGREAWLDIDNKTLKKHHKNLEVRLEQVRANIKNLESRLTNDTYVTKAPKEIVEQSRQELKTSQELETRLTRELELL